MKDDLYHILNRTVRQSNGCMEYPGIKPGLYRCAVIDGKLQSLHRYVAKHKFGNIDGKIVRHRCNNPSCINPEHLLTGTHKDNMKDMVDSGRSLKGVKNHRSILTDDIVRQMRNDFSMGMARKNIADKYNVKIATVKSVIAGYRWSHVL